MGLPPFCAANTPLSQTPQPQNMDRNAKERQDQELQALQELAANTRRAIEEVHRKAQLAKEATEAAPAATEAARLAAAERQEAIGVEKARLAELARQEVAARVAAARAEAERLAQAARQAEEQALKTQL